MEKIIKLGDKKMGHSFENKLYEGKVTIMFDVYQHKYTWVEEEEDITSVTTALKIISKPALISWAANVAVDYMTEKIEPGMEYDEVELAGIFKGARQAHWQKKTDAGDVGTLLHKWIESYINGEQVSMPVNEQMKISIKRFLKWKKDHKVKFLSAEQVVFSKKHRFSGTIDFICSINNKMYIGDLKTSKGVYAEMMMQTAAYRLARQEEFPEEKYSGMLILRIGSNGTFEIAIIKGKTIFKQLAVNFLHALSLSNGLESIKNYRPSRNP